MTVKVIIFDFDGTLADTLDSIVSISNRLAAEFGYQPASKEDIQQLRNLNSNQIIKTSRIPLSQLPFLIQRVQVELSNEIQNLTPVLGIKEVVRELHDRGFTLGILTGNSTKNVMGFLNTNNLGDFFDFVYSGSAIFGKDKVINAFLNRDNINPKEVIYVGDETRDIDAARITGVQVIAVGWGFNSNQVLAEQKPDFFIDHPKEILSVIESLENTDS